MTLEWPDDPTVAQSRRLAVVDREEELRSVLRSAWPAVTIEPSAFAALSDINLDALREVVVAAQRVSATPVVTRVEGFRSREDSDWVQLLLVAGLAGEAGSETWRKALAEAGAVIESAVAHNPRLAGAITSQISFDI